MARRRATPVRRRPRGKAPSTRGRPRSAAVDAAIQRAALALFFEHGIQGVRIERIARRARVAKTSIYRRWPSREALLAQAIETFRNSVGPTIELIERTPPERFLALLLETVGVAARPEVRTLVTRLIGSIADSPSLMAAYHASYFAPRRTAMLAAFGRMRQAGLVPAATDLELLVDTLIGALIHRVMSRPLGDDTPDAVRAYIARLLRNAGITVPERDR